MKDITIGILGGMGTYATIHAFEQYAEVFPAQKEWERPRIVIDNRCTMPSRVRAYIYHENVDQLVDEMSESLKHLVDIGCNKIILACNTSHLFLPYIYKKYPEIEESIIHIVETCAEGVKIEGIKSVYLLASEGTIESKIYQNILQSNCIECIAPNTEEYGLLRECIEAVKQNKYDDHIKNVFLDLMNRYDACILGCTELPILYEKYKKDIRCSKIFDPVFLALKKIKMEFENE